MVLRCEFSALLLLSTLVLIVLGIDPYSSDSYIRRTEHAVAVVNKTLYIDGGEISQYINGKLDSSRSSRQVNDTHAIPLDVSWTNKSVVITAISKAAPPFDSEALWTDKSTNSIYMWGGQGPWGNLSKTRDLWKFEPASSTGEAWTKHTAANVDVFLTIVRSTGAAYTTCNGAGFYVGGYGSVWTDPVFAAGNTGVPVPGMLTYNVTTGSWTNESTAGLNNLQTLISGSATCLPSFGSAGQGVVMVLGGEVAQRTGYNQSAPNLVGLGNVTFWDIETKTWFSQQTTGDIPTPRSRFCVVGADGPNGTHEIFVFGGYDASTNTGFEDIYVLSIPGFVWFKAGITTGGPRAHHQCVLAGNRQMIVVGGIDPVKAFTASYQDPDPWTNGIGVIDVSALSWKDSFHPDAKAYASPDVVTSWYNAGNQDKVSWTSNTVKSLFVTEDGTSSGDGASGGTNSSGSSTSPSSSTPVGAIAGGVVGGVAVLAIAGLVLFLVRSKKQNRAQDVAKDASKTYQNTPPPVYGSPMEKINHDTAQELPHATEPRSPAMLSADSTPSELATGNWHTDGERERWGQHQQGHHAAYEMG